MNACCLSVVGSVIICVTSTLSHAGSAEKHIFNEKEFSQTMTHDDKQKFIQMMENVKARNIMWYFRYSTGDWGEKNKPEFEGSDAQIISVCAEKSINDKDENCDFIEDFFDMKKYQRYVKNITTQIEKEIAAFGSTYKRIESVDDIKSRLHLVLCSFYRWCREHPKSAKYLLIHKTDDEKGHYNSGLYLMLMNSGLGF